jgi:transcription elongation factor GreA
MKKVYKITEHGRRELEAELNKLIEARPDVADRIAEARSFGDLSENTEYSAAREVQAQSEARIAEIQEILDNVEIIEDAAGETVGLGSTVVLKNGKKSQEYKMVGAVEADPLDGKISDESPLGRELMGKTNGDKVTIETPKGKTTFEIAQVW